jgi:hypothetical protein
VVKFYSIGVIRLIVSLINGHMRTPKIEALHRLMKWLNNRPDQIENCPLLPLDNSPILANTWLSGFIEADGSFYVDAWVGPSNPLGQAPGLRPVEGRGLDNFYTIDK